jgi:DNA repair photolyase
MIEAAIKNNEAKLRFKTIHVHEREFGNPLLEHMRRAHPHAQTVSIKYNTQSWKGNYGLVSLEPKDRFREKRDKAALLHRNAKWRPDPNGNSTDFLPGIMMAQGCGFGCTYCYTERHFKNNYPKLYGDVFSVVDMMASCLEDLDFWRDKMRQVARKDFERHRDPSHGDFITFDLGCDSDCVLDNQLTAHANYPGHIVDVMNRASQIPKCMTSFATKSAAVGQFLDHIERPEHHRIRLSLMPEHHRKRLEINTASVVARLDAVNKLVAAGFEVHINLSPIVVTEDYESEYQDLLRLIDDSLTQDAKDQLAYEVIFLTHTVGEFDAVKCYAPKAHDMMVHGPLDLVPKPNKANVLSYSRSDKKRLKEQLRGWVSEITPYSRIRYNY